MKEIKVFIHRSSIADVIRALKSGGFERMSVVDVKGMLDALSEDEREYSLELGQEVITETKLEVFCENERLEDALEIIRKNATTSQQVSGWIYVSDTVAMALGSSPYQ